MKATLEKVYMMCYNVNNSFVKQSYVERIP